jgi:DNA-binding NarL/FixJ family response regulator
MPARRARAAAVATATCVIADDHPAFLAGVRERLARDGYEIAAEAVSGPETLAAVEREAPDFAVVDLRMPGVSGLDFVRSLHDAAPGTRIILYTAEVTSNDAFAALDSGAQAVILKEAPLADLSRAVRLVLDGARYLDPGLAPMFGGTDGVPLLTDREAEVLRLLAEGLAFAEIGKRLSIGGETARTHVRNATLRLGAKTKTEAVAAAMRMGLIS